MPPLYILSLWLLFVHTTPWCSSSATASNDTLMAGQNLAFGDKLVSRNGKFALGFFQFHPASTISKSSHNTTSPSPSLWYLGIWFNKIPVLTTVWIANRDQPITNPNVNLTQLKISRDGNLVIVNHAANNESIVWSTHIVNNRTHSSIKATSSAVLLNSGNLVLKESRSSDLLAWQSFDYPTDVVLAGAKLGRNKVTSFTRQPISKKSLIDPGLGSYSIELEDTRGLVLSRRNNPSVVYWQYASSTTSSFNLVRVLNSLLDSNPLTKGLYNLVYVDNDQEEYYMYTSHNEPSPSVFVSLDMSGQIKLNHWSQANQSWQIIYAQPDDPCNAPAACGPFTVCRGNPNPSCDCMESFSQKSPQDWKFQDRTGGCIRNTPSHCTSDKNITSSTDMFQPIAQVTLPYNPQIIAVATTQSECEETCLGSCSCTAYSYNDSKCSVWNGELLSVTLSDGIEYTSKDVLYLRLAAKDFMPSLRKNKRKPNVGVVTAASIIGFGLLMLMFLLLIWRNRFKWCGFLSSYYDNQGSVGGIIAFRYTDLVRATKNFSDKLGGGGFGSVYKGVLSDSKTTVAVKRLDGARQGEKQFRAEVSSIGLIQHINLVKLVGFCCEGDHRLLVYEHMLNGSLDGHLFKKSNNVDAVVLNWNTRYQISLGIARGLSYLHQSCRECIIHCDIKPENILVDAAFVPKVADFGLAAFVGRDFSRILTSFRGTIGYLAPEWLSGVAITPKVDVYGFGMVLLEIISGRRNSSPEISHSTESSSNSYQHHEYFPVQAIKKLHEGDVKSLMDTQLHGDFNLEEAERVCKVASWCIQGSEFDRPTMSEVVRVLEGLQEIDIPPMPRLLAAMMEQSDAATSM
ncbi:G-type lectin S-receptor-like serine/threonine-protein kinase At2g19130 [Triticum urartu]|uniref:Receptor-like serine/threonine-protein kinase n=1 Tax=Triticum urartu TaxID=4572 RepID=A0A8R7TKV6_TRIUA|nr:G-type lectin S-receptor-like serine/threonine-protein kinase At2g19130 [Triticum urartu]XP_048558326.1 G-type lectin S-receptor-like serine/threonine-protein kinase At2g19130 [Triticum urartu]